MLSADPIGGLEALGKASVAVENAEFPDALHLRICIDCRDLGAVEALAAKRGDQIEKIRRRGLYFRLLALGRRPVLVLGLLALLLLSLWTPTRVLFVEVEGNTTVPTLKIVEQAAACGIGFGASRREVRSEKIKNALLEAMPELQWVGVNTYGCTAVITVRERSTAQAEQTAAVSSIYALRDGVIHQMTVTQGSAACAPGQTVEAGQLLVSGYTDCGLTVRATQAKAEIYADTQRTLTAVLPTNYARRTQLTATKKNFSLIIGKNRINFFKGSGISGMTCAKIYSEKYLTLPGGFVLPIALCCEQWFCYDSVEGTVSDAETILQAFAADYLPREMLAGTVCSASQVFTATEDYCRLDGIYDCYEMIGVSKPEESLTE